MMIPNSIINHRDVTAEDKIYTTRSLGSFTESRRHSILPSIMFRNVCVQLRCTSRLLVKCLVNE
jgi:hypothetical protein